jgi:hypothetical protein
MKPGCTLPLVSVTLAVALAGAACGTSNPAQPTSSVPGSTSPSSSASFVAPPTFTPALNAQIAYASQPVTLMIANVVSTASGASAYTFEVATDAAFSNIVLTNANVPQGSGQTSSSLTTLQGSTTYYWRVKVTTGGVAGPTSTVRAFTIGAQVTLQTPVLSSPAQNGTSGSPATLTVNNVQTTGPVGALVYRFQVADSSAFTNILFDSTIPQQSGGQTSVTVTANLTTGVTYYWRVQATDSTNNITTPFSTVFAFQPAASVIFDHPWSGNVELALRALLATGLGGPDGLNGDAVVNQMNSYGGIYAGAEFQPAHDGPDGPPVYGFGWFYVAYVPIGPNGALGYQIVEYGAPPPGD